MAFCPNCGAQAQGAFCPNCGASVASSSGPAAQGVPVATASGLEPHIAAALCYTPLGIGLIASIIFLLVAPYNQNKFVRFNTFQSLFLHAGIIVCSIVIGIIVGIMTAMIHALGLLFVFLWPIIWVAILILMLYMMYSAFNNKTVSLPFIGDLAQKQS